MGVNIVFKGERLREDVLDPKKRRRRWGPDTAKALARRLDELRAAENLEVLRSLPQAKCHELKGDRQGELAVRLTGPWRLVFEPANEPPPVKADGGLDWSKVTSVRVTEVVDYHD